MIKHLFYIKDTGAELYMGPYTSINLQTFQRDVLALRDSDTQFGKHPQDFAVYSCGTVNDTSGVIEVTPPVFVINMDDLFKSFNRGE